MSINEEVLNFKNYAGTQMDIEAIEKVSKSARKVFGKTFKELKAENAVYSPICSNCGPVT